MNVQRLHHVAYRCRDARTTTDFYTSYLGLRFTIALAENRVPSTREWSPHIHIFFELPESPEMGLDPATPAWVQHLALDVPDMETLPATRDRLEAGGVEVVGPTDHGFCRSIDFFDPDGHRMELTVNTMTPELAAGLQARATAILEAWSRNRRAPAADPVLPKSRG